MNYFEMYHNDNKEIYKFGNVLYKVGKLDYSDIIKAEYNVINKMFEITLILQGEKYITILKSDEEYCLMRRIMRDKDFALLEKLQKA